jgi:hypothetical protein
LDDRFDVCYLYTVHKNKTNIQISNKKDRPVVDPNPIKTTDTTYEKLILQKFVHKNKTPNLLRGLLCLNALKKASAVGETRLFTPDCSEYPGEAVVKSLVPA